MQQSSFYSEKNLDLQICNLQGQVLKAISVQRGKSEIALPDLPPGTYMARIHGSVHLLQRK
jgi:hypothetical protein